MAARLRAGLHARQPPDPLDVLQALQRHLSRQRLDLRTVVRLAMSRTNVRLAKTPAATSYRYPQWSASAAPQVQDISAAQAIVCCGDRISGVHAGATTRQSTCSMKMLILVHGDLTMAVAAETHVSIGRAAHRCGRKPSMVSPSPTCPPVLALREQHKHQPSGCLGGEGQRRCTASPLLQFMH